jgi:hypothetical protein
MTITNVIKTLELLAGQNQAVVPFLQGSPGVGKSQIVKQVADRLGYAHYLDIRLSQHDATDLKGIPQQTDEGVLRWIPPEFMPLVGSKWDDGQPGVLFFDELNRAPVEVLQAVFEIVHDRRIGMKPVLDNWFIVAAGNYGYEDGTDVVEMDAALRNRFMMLPVDTPTFPEWRAWAEQAGINSVIIDYLQENEDDLYYVGHTGSHELVTPRTWEKLSRVLSTVSGTLSETADLVAPSFLFSIAPKFTQYVRETSAVRVKDIIENYDSVSDDLNKLDRHEVLSIVEKLDGYIKNNPINDIQGFTKFFRNHLTEDNQVAMILRLFKSDAGRVVVEKFLKANPDINVENPSLFKKIQEAYKNGQ